MSTLDIHNPANGELIIALPADDAASVADKVATARAAQPAWAALPLARRRACIEGSWPPPSRARPASRSGRRATS